MTEPLLILNSNCGKSDNPTERLREITESHWDYWRLWSAQSAIPRALAMSLVQRRSAFGEVHVHI